MKLRYLIIMAFIIAVQGCKSDDEVGLTGAYKNSIDGFYGIKWGTSINSTINILRQKSPEAKIYIETPFELSYLLEDCTFKLLDTKMSGLYLQFGVQGFYNSLANFSNLTEDKSAMLYQKLVEILKSKYGKPSWQRIDNGVTYSTCWTSHDSCSVFVTNNIVKKQIALMFTNNLLK